MNSDYGSIMEQMVPDKTTSPFMSEIKPSTTKMVHNSGKDYRSEENFSDV